MCPLGASPTTTYPPPPHIQKRLCVTRRRLIIRIIHDFQIRKTTAPETCKFSSYSQNLTDSSTLFHGFLLRTNPRAQTISYRIHKMSRRLRYSLKSTIYEVKFVSFPLGLPFPKTLSPSQEQRRRRPQSCTSPQFLPLYSMVYE